MLKRLFLCFMVLVIYPLGLWAQEAHEGEFRIKADNALSIEEVVSLTLSRSPDKILLKAKEKNTKAYTSRAASFFAATPEISLRHQNDSLGADQGLREWESSLDLPLWMPGQRSASKQKARMSEKETRAYEQLVIWQVRGEIVELLWQIKLAQSDLDQSHQNLEMALALEKDLLRKIAAGNLPKRAGLLSRKEVMSRKMQVIEAEREYIHSAKQYEAITGLKRMPANVTANFSEDFLHKNETYMSPTIALADANVAFLQAAYREKSREWNVAPRLSLGVRREKSSYLDRNIDSVSLGLSMPLGSGAHMAPRRAAAGMALAEAERQREIIKREHRLHLHEAEHELEVCESQLPLTENHYDLAAENLRLSQKAFDLGESDLRDLLIVREQFYQSSSQKIQKNIECKRAIARHNQIKGVMQP